MVKLTYTYTCVTCGESAVESYDLYIGVPSSAVPNPGKPIGWTVMNASLYCGKHIFTISDKPRSRDIVIEMNISPGLIGKSLATPIPEGDRRS